MTNNKPPAYILCGGDSSRMGEDKARQQIGDAALVQHVARQLAPWCASVTLVAQSAGAYDDLGLTTIGDRAPGLGPLGGLDTAMQHRLDTHGSGWLLLAACDTLMRDSGDLSRLEPTHDTSHAVAWRGDYWHPMPGRYHTDLTPLVGGLLANGERRFQALLNHEQVCASPLPISDGEAPPTLNLNTPRDLAQARKMLGDG